MSQGVGSSNGVLDFTTVRIQLGEFSDLLLVDFGWESNSAILLEECLPYKNLRVYGKLRELESDVDARKERVIESLNPIGGQEQNASVVLQVSQASNR